MVSLTEAKGTMGKLLMQKGLYTRMEQSLGRLDQLLVQAKGLTGDLRPTAKNLQEFTNSINKEIEPLKAIVANIKASSEDLPAPLLPRIATRSPWSTFKEMSQRTWVSPRNKSMLQISSIG